jgi:hypothetical protein
MMLKNMKTGKEMTSMGSAANLQQETEDNNSSSTWKEDLKKLKKENLTY